MPELTIEQNHPLAEHTTFRIGGAAEYFAMPGTPEAFREAIRFAHERGLRRYILGGGSNTLFSDEGFHGLVICTTELRSVEINGSTVTALCGTDMDTLCGKLVSAGLSGLEFAGGLPGSVGGAAVMNARAYGGEISDVVSKVTAVLPNGDLLSLSPPELHYAYKQSVFMERPELAILSVELTLRPSASSAVKDATDKNREDRRSKGQYAWPSAGCVFKNCYELGVSSGGIIDSLGLKGLRVGGAEVYEKHANFIVNRGGAKASEVLALMEQVNDEIYKAKGVKLEAEVRVVE